MKRFAVRLPVHLAVAALLAGGVAVSGCGMLIEEAYVEPVSNKQPPRTRAPTKADEGLFGPGGLSFSLWGNDKKAGPGAGGGGGAGVGVNSYLWRASLDTVSFMPLASADPFGGVIITDWYAPPEAPNERFKMSVYILGRELRADAVRVAVFRQNRTRGGDWADSAVATDTAGNLENQILTRARELRMAATASR